MQFHRNPKDKIVGTMNSIFTVADVCRLETYEGDYILGAEVFYQGIYYMALTFREIEDGYVVGLFDLSNMRRLFDEFFHPIQFNLAHGFYLDYLRQYVPTQTGDEYAFEASVQRAIANGDIEPLEAIQPMNHR